MTLLQMSYILEVDRCGSMNRAAQNLFLSQSALSAAIAEVERELGVTVFLRTNRGVTLTEEGRELVAQIAPLVDRSRKLSRYYSERRAADRASLSVASQRYPFCAMAFVEYLHLLEEPHIQVSFKEMEMAAVIEQVAECHAKGQPVLVGTVSVEKSEALSKLLKKKGIEHNVLNAKQHEREAEIVAQAGKQGAVTIATNMAGRGTDIKLDDVAKAAGGLKIIGTERHESRRIDNQLRGRSGRQGDPGESRFYISLEDDLMRLFGSERLMKIFTSLGVAENEQIEHKMLSNAIEKAQEKIEFNNFGIRKNLLDYDQVNNEQREIIYKERRQVLDGENMREAIYKMIQDTVDTYVDMCFSDDVDSEEWDLNEFNGVLTPIIPIRPLTAESVKGKKRDEIRHELKEEAVKLYEEKEAEFPEPEQLRELERVVLLKCIDSKWMDHIDDMEILRQGIGLAAYGQRDPVVEYKMSAFDMFNEMITSIQEDTLRMLYHVHVEQKIEREQVAKVTGTNKDDSAGPKKPVQRKEIKVYPNDPCPCGSGKKYKQCCGRKNKA